MGRLVLFLSPHLDDAVLSCPGYIQRRVKEGLEVRVVTVFTSGGTDAAALYRVRRSEDRKAVRELGASATHLGLPDSPFRSPKYEDFCGIVFGRAREYSATRRVVTQAIGELLSRLRPVEIASPLAVGNHVDHRLVRDAALEAVPLEALYFYEDRPYAFIREQVGHVLGRSLAPGSALFWKRYFAAAYVRSYCGGASQGRIIRKWAAVPPFPLEYRLRQAFGIEIRPVELAHALAAMRAYRTQMPDLFADISEPKSLYAGMCETIYRASRAAR